MYPLLSNVGKRTMSLQAMQHKAFLVTGAPNTQFNTEQSTLKYTYYYIVYSCTAKQMAAMCGQFSYESIIFGLHEAMQQYITGFKHRKNDKFPPLKSQSITRIIYRERLT